MSASEDRLFDLVEELEAAVRRGEAIDRDLYAGRFDVDATAVADCVRALAALDLSLGEESESGLPELPQPHFPDTYSVGREIGRGGMGVVYEAVEESLGRRVALKVLRPGDLHFGDAIRRFRGEARALARLRHPHIVSVHSVGETAEGLVFYAMDLVDGDTLAEEIEEVDGLTPTQSLRLMRQITGAVAHAHAQGIIHRDLKPQNVLIDERGDAFVCDFGLAQDALVDGVGLTRTGNLLGTPAYMSPEQASGKTREIGESTDVWALGALLYECLTGRGPFSGRPLHETIQAILHDDPTPPRRIDRRIPQALESIALKALRKNPAQRYATTEAFGEDLERFAEGREVTARPLTVSERTLSIARRNQRTLRFAGSLLLLVALAVGFGLVPEIRRATRIAEAQRALESGFPGAAIETLDGLAIDTPEDGLRFAIALNNRAGELLEEGQPKAAREAAERAIELGKSLGVEDHQTVRGAVALSDLEQPWRWEAFRARRLATATGALDPFPSLWSTDPDRMDRRWFDSIESPLRGRRATAKWIAIVEGLDHIARLPAGDRISAVLEWHRHLARSLPWSQQQPRPTSEQWFPWSRDAHRVLWSPELEDALVRLARSDTESQLTRAFACRSWSQLTGMPFVWVKSTGIGEWANASVERTEMAIRQWESWRQLGREAALDARLQYMAASLPEEEGRGSHFFTRKLVAAWFGTQTRPRPDVLSRVRNGELGAREWIAKRLGSEALAMDPQDCLGRAANSESDDALLWRHVAFLRLPDGVHVPEGLFGYTHWFAAFGESRPAPYVATAALLCFENGAADPIVVGSTRLPAKAGSRLEVEFVDGRRPPDLPLRWKRGYQTPRQPETYYGEPRHTPNLKRSLGLEVRMDDSGPVLTTGSGRGRGSGAGSRVSGWTTDARQGGGVRLGQARSFAYVSVEDSALGTLREYLLVYRLDEIGLAPNGEDVSSWRQGVVSCLRNAVEDREVEPDILTTRFWALPEAKESIERNQKRELEKYGNYSESFRDDSAGYLVSPSISWLAGSGQLDAYDLETFGQNARCGELLRMILHAPRAAWRQRALEKLATIERLRIPSALEQPLRDRLASDELEMPPSLELALEQARALRNPGWSSRSVRGYLALAISMLLMTILSPLRFRLARLAAWIATGLAVYLSTEALGFGGRDLLPASVCLSLAAFASLWVSRRRATLEKRILAALLIGSIALLELGAEYGTVTLPRSPIPILMLFVAGIVLLSTIQWRALFRRKPSL